MTFEQALAELKKGKKVERQLWGFYFIYLREKEFYWKAEGKSFPFRFTSNDLLADDWEIVE